MDNYDIPVLLTIFFTLTFFVLWWYEKSNYVKDRLAIRRADKKDQEIAIDWKNTKTIINWTAEKIKEYRHYAQKYSNISPGEKLDINEKLLAAGKPHNWNEYDVWLLEMIAVVVVIISITLCFYAITDTLWSAMASISVSVPLGRKVPMDMLAKKAKQRQQEAREKLAEAIDRIAICASASNNVLDAIRAASKTGTNVIYEELRKVVVDTDKGQPLSESLYVFKQRLALSELIDVYQTMEIADRQGGSHIHEQLVELSDIIRQRERDRIAQGGAKIASKIVAPMLICMVPVILTLYIGPAILAAIKG